MSPGTYCPECRSAGAVVGLRCQICDADPRGSDPKPLRGIRFVSAGRGRRPSPDGLAPSSRFSEVVAELRGISDLLAHDPARVQEACRRAEEMLAALREQFIGDVVKGRPAPAISRSGP
jgi:hypothetical protein